MRIVFKIDKNCENRGLQCIVYIIIKDNAD